MDLKGAYLDWWVAKCEDVQGEIHGDVFMRKLPHQASEPYCPSADWLAGGPIIERKKIVLNYDSDQDELEPWAARMGYMKYDMWGETPLIAAMRCYAVSEFGMTESGAMNDRFCPYCESENNCDHLLLRLDLTFREFQGGALADAVEERWASITEENSENDGFDEAEAFSDLLSDVMMLADSERYWESDGGPGESSSYQAYYSKNAEAGKIAVAKWISQNGIDKAPGEASGARPWDEGK